MESNAIKLSICITTRNRGVVIGKTLDSILEQMQLGCEVVVLDAASEDSTEECVRQYARRFPFVRYIRADTNNGIDADYDRTVELARGEYCWLASDDDLFNRQAIATVLSALQEEDYSLVIVNARSVAASTLQPLELTRFKFAEDRVYEPNELDRLFLNAADALAYIGCVVIKRSVWIARERQRYYGSFFIHFGVIFQERLPGRAKIVVAPLIDIAEGNARSFTSRICEISCYRLPQLVQSLALLPSTKNERIKPWRKTGLLLLLRACGGYSLQEYRRWIVPNGVPWHERLIPVVVALLPVGLLNSVMIPYYSVFRRNSTELVWLRNRRI